MDGVDLLGVGAFVFGIGSLLVGLLIVRMIAWLR